MNPEVSKHVFVAHALSGCDTLSFIHGEGKKSVLKTVTRQTCDCLNIFRSSNASHDDIADAEEWFVLHIYGAPKSCSSLDKLRYIKYVKKLNISFQKC